MTFTRTRTDASTKIILKINLEFLLTFIRIFYLYSFPKQNRKVIGL